MTPALFCSLVLHAGGAVALAVDFALWPWVAATLVANHLVLLAGVLLVRGRLLGPNLNRLPAAAVARGHVCLTFDDGPHPEITRRVLELLERHQARASFFCVGRKAEAHPEIVREIARRGHSVENHSHRHPNAFALYGISLLRREVETAQAALTAITGRAPQFFRAPMGLRSPLLGFVLGAHRAAPCRGPPQLRHRRPRSRPRARAPDFRAGGRRRASPHARRHRSPCFPAPRAAGGARAPVRSLPQARSLS
jgi:peptidoglycan/xylan/chitin deacetylase (PgdA/CDA1 family)